MINHQPFVSVLMTSYNREKYISDAIESVLKSTYINWELIIVDDLSKDRTLEIAKSFSEKDNRIKVYVNEKNLGDYPNRNKAVSYANGELIVFVDSDDTLNYDALEYIVKAFNLYPDANYAIIYDHIKDQDTLPQAINSETAIRQHFFQLGFLHKGPGGSIVRRAFFYKIGCFPEIYGTANDMYYHVKAASNSSVILLPYNYFFYREHEGQENKNRFSYLHNTYVYYKDLMALPELPLTADERKYLLLKSKRRFIVNLWKYYRKTGKVTDIFKAIRLAQFRFSDFLKGIFQ